MPNPTYVTVWLQHPCFKKIRWQVICIPLSPAKIQSWLRLTLDLSHCAASRPTVSAVPSARLPHPSAFWQGRRVSSTLLLQVQHQCTGVPASSPIPCRGSSLKPWQFERHHEIFLHFLVPEIFKLTLFSFSAHHRGNLQEAYLKTKQTGKHELIIPRENAAERTTRCCRTDNAVLPAAEGPSTTFRLCLQPPLGLTL